MAVRIPTSLSDLATKDKRIKGNSINYVRDKLTVSSKFSAATRASDGTF